MAPSLPNVEPTDDPEDAAFETARQAVRERQLPDKIVERLQQSFGLSLVDARLMHQRASLAEQTNLTPHQRDLLPDGPTGIAARQFSLASMFWGTLAIAIPLAAYTAGLDLIISIWLIAFGFFLTYLARRWYARTWIGFSIGVLLMWAGNQFVVWGAFLPIIAQGSFDSIAEYAKLMFLLVFISPIGLMFSDASVSTASLVLAACVHLPMGVAVSWSSFRRDSFGPQFVMLLIGAGPFLLFALAWATI